MGLIREGLLRDFLPRQRQQRVPQRRPPLAMQSDQHVFENAVALKNAGALECSDQAKAGDLMRLEAIQQCSAIADLAMRRLEKPGEDVESGCLASALPS